MGKLDPATKAAIKALVDAALARKGATVRDLLATVLATPRIPDVVRDVVVRQIKARIVAQRFADHPGKNTDGVLSIQPSGSDQTVAIGQVTYSQQDDTVPYVDVYTAGPTVGGDPHFRIINPPTLVEDPNGDIVVTSKAPNGKTVTRKYREDPVAAIAEAIAGQGGARR